MDVQKNIRTSEGMDRLTWEKLYTYLYIDLKHTDSKSNTLVTKSRFGIIKKFFDKRAFNRETVNDFIASLKTQGYKANYINNFIKLLKHIGRLLGTTELNDYSYFKKPKYHYVEVLTPEEKLAICEVSIPYRNSITYHRTGEQIALRYKALYYLLSTTGCRINEALSLLWEDVFLESKYLVFRTSKNGDERVIPLTQTVITLLAQLPKDNTRVFEMKDDTEVNRDLKKRSEILGIKKRVYCHIFRHSFISEAQKRKIPLTFIMKITGHRSLESIPTYSHALIGELAEALSVLPMWQMEQTVSSLDENIEAYLKDHADRSRYALHYTITDKQTGESVERLL